MHQNEIQRYHVDLLNNGILERTADTVWAAHKGNLSNPNYMWKMHLYADSYQDWYNLSRVVIDWLVDQNATFKTVNPDMDSINSILQDRTDDQFGKAFTIYPNNENNMAFYSKYHRISHKTPKGFRMFNIYKNLLARYLLYIYG